MRPSAPARPANALGSRCKGRRPPGDACGTGPGWRGTVSSGRSGSRWNCPPRALQLAIRRASSGPVSGPAGGWARSQPASIPITHCTASKPISALVRNSSSAVRCGSPAGMIATRRCPFLPGWFWPAVSAWAMRGREKPIAAPIAAHRTERREHSWLMKSAIGCCLSCMLRFRGLRLSGRSGPGESFGSRGPAPPWSAGGRGRRPPGRGPR